MASLETLHSLSGEFLVVADDGYVDLWVAAPDRLTVTAYALVQRGYLRWRIYGPDGQVRRIRTLVPERPLGPLGKVLAYTVYNPRLETAVVYAPSRAYALEELKDDLRRAVERDDDILTQFVEAEELHRHIGAARSRSDLLGVIRRASTPPDDYSSSGRPNMS
jgi:hypothetical protein